MRSVTETRKIELQNIVRDQISNAIDYDLTSGETLMKEAYEQADDEAELAVVYAEMRAIIQLIRRVVR